MRKLKTLVHAKIFFSQFDTIKAVWINLLNGIAKYDDTCDTQNLRYGMIISISVIEIGLEQAPFFSSFEHVKSLLIMGPNKTKNSSLKCDFLIINYE